MSTSKCSENFSGNFTEFEFVKEPSWLVPVIINLALLLASLWITISLIHHGIKTEKWRQLQASNLDKLSGGMVYTSVVVCSVMCFCRYILTLVHMSIGYGEGHDKLCDIFSDVTSSFYAFVLFATGLFLWARQRIFYTHRMLNVNYTKVVRIFSSASIFVILLFGFGVLIFSTMPNDHPSTKYGCTYVADDTFKVGYWLSIVLVIGFGQVSLLCLFVYALKTTKASKASFSARRSRKHSETSKSMDTECESVPPISGSEKIIAVQSCCNVSNNNNKKKRSKILSLSPEERVKAVLWKTFIFAAITFLTDLLIQVFSFFISKPCDHRRIVTTLLNVNAILNLLFVVFSFSQYKQMLFSPFY